MATQEKKFQLVDALLMWEGPFNITDLMAPSSLSRKTVQNATSAYKKQFPTHYSYSPPLKTNLVTAAFNTYRDDQRLWGKKYTVI